MEREGILNADHQIHGGDTMERNRFATAGWMSIAMAVLALPGSLMHIMIDMKGVRTVIPFSIGLDLVIVGFMFYVLVKLRAWLHENYGFHGVDTVITLIILGNLVIVPLAGVGRALGLAQFPGFMIALYGVIAYLSILMIIFAARFLRIEGGMRGLKKPIAYVGMAIAVCYLSFFLIIPGVLLGAVFDLLVGLLLLQKPAEEVEYV